LEDQGLNTGELEGRISLLLQGTEGEKEENANRKYLTLLVHISSMRQIATSERV
jgi:hypothetical protein